VGSHWVNNRPDYRCRHGHTSARKRPPGLAKNVYIREDRLLAGLPSRLLEAGTDRQAAPQAPGAGHGGEDTAPADHLRSNELVIVYRLDLGDQSSCSANPARRAGHPRSRSRRGSNCIHSGRAHSELVLSADVAVTMRWRRKTTCA
jgi:hypothetical protein